MQLVEYAEKGVLFRKGDVADYFYILISGEVIIYDDVCSLVDFSESYEIKEKVMNRLLPVSQFGEKAFEYKQNKRTMNAKFSSQNNMLIRVDGKDYIKFLQVENQRQREIMIKNLEYSLPRFNECIRSVKEKNIYYFKSWKFSRGYKIIRQRMKVDQLYFIVNGECLICSESKDGSKVIQLTILCSGAFFGEESVFFGKHSSYDVIVKSDCCEAISIKQEDLLNLPQNVYQELLDQVKVKSILRKFAKKKQVSRQNKQDKKQPQQLKHITRGTMQLSTQIISSNIRKTLDRLITNEQKISQESKHFKQTHKNLASARGETAKHFEFPKLKKS